MRIRALVVVGCVCLAAQGLVATSASGDRPPPTTILVKGNKGSVDARQQVFGADTTLSVSLKSQVTGVSSNDSIVVLDFSPTPLETRGTCRTIDPTSILPPGALPPGTEAADCALKAKSLPKAKVSVRTDDGTDTVGVTIGPDARTRMYLGGGGDIALGGPQELNIDGGAGNDTLEGGAGNDYLKGGSGDDDLLGAGGTDKLHGLDGRDVIRAASPEADADYLYCGFDFDSYTADSADRLSNCELEL